MAATSHPMDFRWPVFNSAHMPVRSSARRPQRFEPLARLGDGAKLMQDEASSGSLGNPFAGPELEEEDAIPEVFNGAFFGDVLNVPSEVVGGQSFTVSGTVGFDCPHCVLDDRAIRVEAVLEDGTFRRDNVGPIPGFGGGTRNWEIQIPSPPEGGTEVIRLKAQRRDPALGWITDSQRGPFEVNAVTREEKTQSELIGMAPWVLGGGAVGLGAAQLTGRSAVGGAVAGAGAGLAANMLLGDVDLSPILGLPGQIANSAIWAGGGAGAGLLLSQLDVGPVEIDPALGAAGGAAVGLIGAQLFGGGVGLQTLVLGTAALAAGGLLLSGAGDLFSGGGTGGRTARRARRALPA